MDPAELIEGRTELSLSALGLEVVEKGVDWGESAVEVQLARQAIGESVTNRHLTNVECTVPLRVQAESGINLAEAAHRLQQKVGLWQAEGGWIRRDFDAGGKFAGSVAYQIKTANLSGLGGWLFAHRQSAPEVTLKLLRHPVCFATSEIEGSEVKGSEVRDLQWEISNVKGSAPGLLRLRVKNENSSGDWRGLISSIESRDLTPGSSTAELAYEAVRLSPRGGAVISGNEVPVVRAVGAVAAGTGAISPGLPAGTVAGDLLVMVAESGGAIAEGGATTALTAAGWTEAPLGSQQKGNTRLTILYKIATGGDATTTNDTGDHQLARIIGIKTGTFDPAAPFNASARGTQAATKAISIPGVTTTRDNCLIIWCASGNLPDATTTTEFTTGAAAERIDNTTAEGDGGAIFAATLSQPVHGFSEALPVTAVTEAERALVTLAINGPPAFVQHTTLNSGWTAILGTEVLGSGHMTHLGPRQPWVRVNVPSGTVGNVQLRLVWRVLGASRWVEDNAIVTVPVVGNGNYIWLNLDSVRPQAATLGGQRWEGKLMARALNGSGEIRITHFCPLSTEQYVLLRESGDPAADAEPTKTAGTVAQSGVEGVAWSNPNNVKAIDGALATTAHIGGGGESQFLELTNLGFAIPAGSTIIAIRVTLASISCLEGRAEFMAGLIKGGVRQPESSEEFLAHQSPQTAMVEFTGEGWTVANINASTFGMYLYVRVPGVNPGDTASIDAGTVQVAYTETASENRVCFATRSMELRTDGAYRQAPSSEVWGQLVPDEGSFNVYASPSGMEGRAVRGILIPTQGDLESRADINANNISVKPIYRPGYLFAREAG